MQIHKIPFAEIPQLSARDKAYADESEPLRTFYKYSPDIHSFKQLIQDRKKYPVDRKVLTQVFQKQYQQRTLSEKQSAYLKLLEDEQTFTIITAHQPSLFTGPLYYIYKIISCINLAETLRQHYPDYNFVPVFVSGGEDHDFEEINHIHLFGKRLEWQTDQNGAVGMMHTKDLQEVLDQVTEMLGNSEHAESLKSMLQSSFIPGRTYGEASNEFTNELFKSRGILVLSMNDPELKRLFIPVVREELINSPSKKLIEETTKKLEAFGFGQQAMAREINFFYLKAQIRERIVFEEGKYKVLNQEIAFSEDELLQELEQHPERFSPNVIMRPLFQELILPNLAYIGGGGELAYWMERQSQFKHFEINFPLLVRRNSVLWIDTGMAKKLKKLEIAIPEIFEDTEVLIKAYVHKNSEESLELENEKAQLAELYESAKIKAQKIDPTLAKAVLAEQSRQLKTLEQLESRLLRAEKQKHDTAINQIRSLKEKLFPNNGLQERYDNFMGFYMKYGDDFFEVLSRELHPLEKGFIVIEDA